MAKVNLTWTAPAGAVTFNVKRATVSGGPYTEISAAQTQTTFEDVNVQSGTTYFYVVTAVDANGHESANSNEATAVVPAIAPPTNLTATEIN